MSKKKKTTAALLRYLAEGATLSQAASSIGIDSENAAKVLEKIAERYALEEDESSNENGKIIAYTDGGARGNPGPSGYGVVMEDESGKVIWKDCGFLGTSTNNEAEYQGLLAALKKAVELGISTFEVRSDSKLLVEQMKGNYKVKARNLLPLVMEAQRLARKIGNVVYTHLPREANNRADSLANEAMDRGE